jgi:hypothetical protein
MSISRGTIDLSNIEPANMSDVRSFLHLGLTFAKVEFPPDRGTSLGLTTVHGVEYLRSFCELLGKVPYLILC